MSKEKKEIASDWEKEFAKDLAKDLAKKYIAHILKKRTENQEKILIANLLQLASNVFSNHSCNDLPDEFFKDWDKEEKEALVKKFWEWNGTPEERCSVEAIGNSSLMQYFAEKLLKE